MVDEKFRLKRSLGCGGMAEVMLAQDVALGREVAIKFLGAQLVDDPKWRDRFATEARNMARIRHENVAQVYSYGVHEGSPYFVMEYLDGLTLAAWIIRNPRPRGTDVSAIVARIAAGVTAIHEAGLVHHDIKPSNVLFDGGHRLVVTDLGLARAFCGYGGALSGYGSMFGSGGTPSYMAPEQLGFGNEHPSLAPRTDVYQLAMTTFELLAGSLPFHGAPLRAILEHHRAGHALSLAEFRDDLGEAVDRVLCCALERDPLRRYRSPLEFANELEAATQGSPRREPSQLRRKAGR